MAGQPELPPSFERPDLEAVGFTGWKTWNELRAGDYNLPKEPLCYVIYRGSAAPPRFRHSNPGGRFKGQDPTVPAATLEAKWVPGAHTINIGKADVGQRRLKYGRFGAGEPVGHWGGRYIWQLEDSDALLVAWHVVSWVETARDYEKRLLARFRELHEGRLPFANLTS